MWATGITPKDWGIGDTVLIDKNKGPRTDINSYRPVGLASNLYKLWVRMITNALYDYAECNSILSNTQAGFRKHKDYLPNTKRDYGPGRCKALQGSSSKTLNALIIDFTSALNTTGHDKLLWIMYDIGVPNRCHRCGKMSLYCRSKSPSV
jgi:hypothetical protein